MIVPIRGPTKLVVPIRGHSGTDLKMPPRIFNLLIGIMAILFAMHTRDEIKDDADMKQDSRRLSDSSFHFYTNDSFHNQTTFKLKI